MAFMAWGECIWLASSAACEGDKPSPGPSPEPSPGPNPGPSFKFNVEPPLGPTAMFGSAGVVKGDDITGRELAAAEAEVEVEVEEGEGEGEGEESLLWLGGRPGPRLEPP